MGNKRNLKRTIKNFKERLRYHIIVKFQSNILNYNESQKNYFSIGSDSSEG